MSLRDKPGQAEPSFALISSFIIHPSTLPHSGPAVGFIDSLDAALELRARRGRRLTHRGRGYSRCRCVTFLGKVFLQRICDFLFDHVLNGIVKRR
jgi:hypothetical protein